MSNAPPEDAKTSVVQELTPLPGTLLSERSARQGAEPWLFYRRSWHWRWRSYGQVADQVSRGMATWRLAAESAHTKLLAHLHGTQHPDTLALVLAVLGHGGATVLHSPAAGAMAPATSATPSTHGTLARMLGRGSSDVWLQVAAEGEQTGLADPVVGGPQRLIMPAAAGQLEQRSLQPLSAEGMIDQALGELFHVSTESEASTESEVSPRPVAIRRLGARAETLARHLDGCRGPKGQRPILCASPYLGPRDLWCIAWATLLSDAAWVLEPQRDAYAATATWVRPSLLLASVAEEAALHRGLVATPKRHRRLRRLLIVPGLGGSATDATGGGAGLDPQLWAELGVERRVLSLGDPE